MDTTSVAEHRWVMKCVEQNLSASSCEKIGELFCSMFGESNVGDFSISKTKFRYLLNEPLGPYFRNLLLNDMSGAYYTLSFDETTNSAGAKELQYIAPGTKD